MPPVFDIVGPNDALAVFGVKLVGFTADNARKVLVTILIVVVLWGIGRVLRRLTRKLAGYERPRTVFWANQTVRVVVGFLMAVAVVSIWFDDPGRLATAFGLISAGLAFALQKLVTAIAGYFVILRGRIFSVGDRILMGGVRGDVITLGYTRTTIMEMGQPPDIRMSDPSMWVAARQYTGRIVTISNGRVFDEPVYNFTVDFPYLWEELRLPIPYRADHRRAERVLLAVAERHTVNIAEMSEDALRELQRRYFIERADLRPRVYLRLTDNWLELTLRFIAREHGVRDLKDRMNREILAELDEAGIHVASSSTEVVGLPPLTVRLTDERKP